MKFYILTLQHKVLLIYADMNKEEQSKHLDNLNEIRSLMEQSTRFISLSGIAGVFAGVFALIGIFAVYWYSDYKLFDKGFIYSIFYDIENIDFFIFSFIDAAIILILAFGFGAFLTSRKAKQNNQKIWNSAVKKMLIHLFIPLATGGVFCLILLYHNLIILIAPVTLIFYGLALINASKFTFRDIKYLGVIEVLIGLTSAIFYEYGILLWTIGFGLMHIIYGIIMHVRYER